MNERPGWLKVVGGSEHIPSDDDQMTDFVEKSDSPQEVNYTELVNIWSKVGRSLPFNYNTSTKPEILRRAGLQVKGWTVSELHAYLIRPDIWHRPSFTKAVMEEVETRMKLNNFSARD